MEQGHFQDIAYSRRRRCRQGQGEGEREELFAQEPVNIPLLPVCVEVSVRAAPRRPGEAVPCEDAPVHGTISVPAQPLLPEFPQGIVLNPGGSPGLSVCS